jgi:hypothetical protein
MASATKSAYVRERMLLNGRKGRVGGECQGGLGGVKGGSVFRSVGSRMRATAGSGINLNRGGFPTSKEHDQLCLTRSKGSVFTPDRIYIYFIFKP